MASDKTTQAVRVDGKTYVRENGGDLRGADDHSDWDRVAALTDIEIEAAAESDPDAQPLTDVEWLRAVQTPSKKYIHIGVDDDILAFFRSVGGRGYQTRINAVLRQYVEAQKKVG
jgi:uncharacterized protein (DUF4415 family)